MKTENEFLWVDEAIDRKAFADLFHQYHPDGKFTLIKSFKIDKANENVSIELDPGICAIMRYCTDKYGRELGFAIYRFYSEEQFGKYFFSPSKQ